MISWIKGSKEARMALAICAGLLLYRLIAGCLRLAFYDRDYQQWRYGWMIFAALVVWVGAQYHRHIMRLTNWLIRP
jgi:hypothetical protein